MRSDLSVQKWKDLISLTEEVPDVSSSGVRDYANKAIEEIQKSQQDSLAIQAQFLLIRTKLATIEGLLQDSMQGWALRFDMIDNQFKVREEHMKTKAKKITKKLAKKKTGKKAARK